MAELANCPKCDRLFVQNLSGICETCRREEDKQFDIVYKYIRKKENRSATIQQIHTDTGVAEETIMRFVKEGRLRTTQFPNVGYGCKRCGTIIREGEMCVECVRTIKDDLHRYKRESERKEATEKQHTYYSMVDEKIRRKK
ncbi:TIGR03826 family flagellar region protein [Bacillus solimangrovi]|uniref:Flagellar protein n=1 Tax=Bacillus solimangrovi TaxID=1305675 RepID=A0A1E5LDP3_9BACI|nr:TIGR03826 family flagellar region protein [Bacillus solimangrovi]OEH92196.1 hypothetical protein BFG57_02690 [Bacillus solimangrovi]